METLLTIKELAEVLKVTEQTVQRYVLRKAIPYRKIKRMVRFRPSEIETWVDNGGLCNSEEEDNGLEGGLFKQTTDGETER
jgi:excisionase family DNA binding protein